MTYIRDADPGDETTAALPPPGLELDEMVAEKVMGWRLERFGDCWRWSHLSYTWVTKAGAFKAWQFSRDVGAAWLVVERMRALGWHITLSAWPMDKVPSYGHVWHVHLCQLWPLVTHEEQAPTLPHAIALAALAALPAREGQ